MDVANQTITAWLTSPVPYIVLGGALLLLSNLNIPWSSVLEFFKNLLKAKPQPTPDPSPDPDGILPIEIMVRYYVALKAHCSKTCPEGHETMVKLWSHLEPGHIDTFRGKKS